MILIISQFKNIIVYNNIMSVETSELIVSLVSTLKDRVGLEKLTTKTIHIVLKEDNGIS